MATTDMAIHIMRWAGMDITTLGIMAEDGMECMDTTIIITTDIMHIMSSATSTTRTRQFAQAAQTHATT